MLQAKKVDVSSDSHFRDTKEILKHLKKLIMKESKSYTKEENSFFNFIFKDNKFYLNFNTTSVEPKTLVFITFDNIYFNMSSRIEYFKNIGFFEEEFVHEFYGARCYKRKIDSSLFDEICVFSVNMSESLFLRLLPLIQRKILYGYCQDKIYAHKDVLEGTHVFSRFIASDELLNLPEKDLDVFRFLVSILSSFDNNMDELSMQRADVFLKG